MQTSRCLILEDIVEDIYKGYNIYIYMINIEDIVDHVLNFILLTY